jgi:hypothetical protein
MYDWIELPVGAERDFMGYRGRWMGRVQLPKSFSAKENGTTAYQPTTVHRASRQGYVKGQTVLILADPNGRPSRTKTARDAKASIVKGRNSTW